MFTGACGPPEKRRLALVSRSYILRMIVKQAYKWRREYQDGNTNELMEEWMDGWVGGQVVGWLNG